MRSEPSANAPRREGPVTLEVKSPIGLVPKILFHASRLDALQGRTIAELSNGVWEDSRTFPKIREALKKRFPDLDIIPFTEFPIGSEQIDKDGVVELLLQRGCQGVIVGNAA